MDCVVITPPCPNCQLTSEYILDSEKVMRWKNGELIQNVWPEMSSDDREQLISGIHPECWNIMFGGQQ